jgi:hypothetical protein
MLACDFGSQGKRSSEQTRGGRGDFGVFLVYS